jgi:hypothetical protein
MQRRILNEVLRPKDYGLVTSNSHDIKDMAHAIIFLGNKIIVFNAPIHHSA